MIKERIPISGDLKSEVTYQYNNCCYKRKNQIT